MYITLSDLIRDRREALGLSYSQLGQLAGVTAPELVKMYEAGTRHIPIQRLPRWAEALDIDPLDLLLIWLRENAPELYEIVESRIQERRGSANKPFY